MRRLKKWSVCVAVFLSFFVISLLAQSSQSSESQAEPSYTFTDPHVFKMAQVIFSKKKQHVFASGSIDESNLTKNMGLFTVKLYKDITGSVSSKDQNPSNICFSPYSISSVLSMMGSGARGKTTQEMSEVLGFSVEEVTTHQAWEALRKKLSRSAAAQDMSLSVANALFIEKLYSVEEDFIKSSREYYDAEVKRVDFKQNAEKERLNINQWVAQKTREKIRDLLAPEQVTEITRMVLVNAIYFKADWLTPFEPRATHEANFYLNSLVAKKVKMMFRKGNFKNYEDSLVQVVEMPYKGEDFSMIIILPKEKDGWKELEGMLDPEKFSIWYGQWVDQLSQVEHLQVYLPKFKISQKLNLVPNLQELGLKEAIDSKLANFKGISGTADAEQPLFIGAVIHQALIEVDEKGTEAAAATAVEVPVGARADSRPVKVFKADHPFFYILRHNSTGAILFAGRVVDPSRLQ